MLDWAKLREIVQEREQFSLREEVAYKDPALESLKEDIMLHGMMTPALVVKQPTGKFRLLDGYRRVTILAKLAEEGVAGFHWDMLVPVRLFDSGLPLKEQLGIAVSANVKRENLPAEARLKICLLMRKAGATNAEIARCLGVSETSVARDVALAQDPKMMDFVSKGYIAPSAAASLLQAAVKKNRERDLYAAISKFAKSALEKIKREKARRKPLGKHLSEAEQRPRNYLTDVQKNSWATAIANDEPLVEETFAFAAAITDEGNVRRLSIKGINLRLDEMGREDLVRVLEGCSDVAMDVAELLKQKTQLPTQEDKHRRRLTFLEQLGVEDVEEIFDANLEASYSESEPDADDADGEGSVDNDDVDPQLDEDVDDE